MSLEQRYQDLLRERQQLQQEVHTLRHALSESQARLARQRRSHRPRREAENPTSITNVRRRWVELPEEGDPDDPVYRVSYGFVGKAWQLEALDVMFKTIHEACAIGSWVTFDVSVDGDGSSPLVVQDVDGAPLGPLDPGLWEWFFDGEPDAEPPAERRSLDVYVQRGLLVVELA